MRQLLLILFFTIFSSQTQESSFKVTYLLLSEPIQPYEKLWQAVCQVESGGNPLAVGDKHLNGYSYGIAQIRESRLKDYNRRTSSNYSVVDLFDAEVSREIFMYYAVPDFETTCRLWNGGRNGMNKKSTLKYWEAVSALLQNR